jgi:hypothetical protein
VTEPFDAVNYLAGKGKHGRQANGPEVAYPCFFDCNEPDDSRKRKLYVNTDEGWYDCKVCGASGGTTLLQRHFGDEPPKGEKALPTHDSHTKRKILNWAADVGAAMLSNNDDILLDLMSSRGLSPETVLERKIGWVGNNWSLTASLPEQFTRDQLNDTGLIYRDGMRAGKDFFYDHLLIPYIARGNVVQLRGRATDPNAKVKYLTGPGEPVRLYGLDDLDGATDVIITEGEFDAMVLKQHLQSSPEDKVRKIAVVGLAGANGFKEGFEAYFKEAKRVYIGLDPDDTGRREAVKIKDRLGAKARILELPAALPKCDWTEYLLPIPADADDKWRNVHVHAGHGWGDVVALLGKASGKRVFSMSETGTAWRKQKATRQGMLTGFSGLDGAIKPGCLPGQLMVILAKTGTGKTLLLCNMAYYMRQYRWLFFSLEMTREEVYERMQRIYRFWSPMASDDEVERHLSNIWICDENRLSDKDFVDVLDEYHAEVGAYPEVVAVDYLGYFARGQKGNSQYEKTTNAAMQLKAMAKSDDPDKRFFLISPSQVNRLAKEGKPVDMDDARDSGAVEETADFLLAVFRPDEALTPESAAQPSGKLMMSILKSRHGGKGKTFPLQMDLLTLVMVDAGTVAARKAEENNYLAWRGKDYDDLRKLQAEPVQLPIRRDFR